MASDSGSDQYFSLSIISYFWILLLCFNDMVALGSSIFRVGRVL